MAMAVAVNTSFLALDFIPKMQGFLDCATGGRRRFQIHRVSAHAMIALPDSELWWQSRSCRQGDFLVAKSEALDWQADPDDDLSDAAVLHHLRQQAATVPLLSSVFSRSGHVNAAKTLTGSALSASIDASTQGRLLSSFRRYSFRESWFGLWKSDSMDEGIGLSIDMSASFPWGVLRHMGFNPLFWHNDLSDIIVWAGPRRNDHSMFWQLQCDFVDLFSRRALPTSQPRKRRRIAFNQFLQVSDSPIVQDASRGNPLTPAQRFNGVRHRPDRKIWVAEMKPPKHKTKQDFGNFKSEVEAARAVDAAFYHYGKPQLLNFPDTSLQFLSTRPMAPAGLDEKGKVKFVKEEAKALLAASSPPHSSSSNSLQILELSTSPRRCPSGQFRSLSEISWPFSCSHPDEVDAAVLQPQPWVLLEDLDAICDIPTTVGQNNLEALNSAQNTQQGLDCFEDSCTLAAPPNVVNSSACVIQSIWLDSLIWSPAASTYSRSPSRSSFQEETAYALLEHESIWAWSDDIILHEKVEDTIGSTNFEHM